MALILTSVFLVGRITGSSLWAEKSTIANIGKKRAQEQIQEPKPTKLEEETPKEVKTLVESYTIPVFAQRSGVSHKTYFQTAACGHVLYDTEMVRIQDGGRRWSSEDVQNMIAQVLNTRTEWVSTESTRATK